MPLELFSNDIVLDILDLVWALPYNVVSLGNLALCSKRLNDLATPLLYKEINLETWSGEVSLLMTFLRNPKLGYVKFSEHQLLWRSPHFHTLCGSG
jgi:hypothetical protein